MTLTNGFFKVGSDFYHATNIVYNPGVAVTALDNDGYVAAGGQVALQAMPSLSFTTNDVKALLDDFSLTANAITSNPLKVYLQKTVDEGVRDSVCTEYSIAKGLWTISSISLTQGTVASATISVYPCSSDGITSPILVNDAFALPSIDPLEEVLTLGANSINGTTLTRVQGVEIALNNSVQQIVSDGHMYPTFATLTAHAPTITLSGVNAVGFLSLATQKALKLNGTTGLSVGLKTTVNGVITATAGNTLTVKEGLVTLLDTTHAQGSLSSATLQVSIAHNRVDATPILVS